MDEQKLLLFITEIVRRSEGPIQAQLALKQLRKILEQQNCAPELLELLDQTILEFTSYYFNELNKAASGEKILTKERMTQARRDAERAKRAALAARHGRC